MPLNKSIFVLISLSILASACNFPYGQDEGLIEPSQQSGSLNEVFPVDPIFLDFYTFLGGEQILGPAISPLIESGNLKTQYLEAGLFKYDPSAPPSAQYGLAPLGVTMGISEPPVPDPGVEGTRYSNGHIIYGEFLPLYEELGGARFVGRPLTEVQHNPEKGRIEQYFENLGFYRLDIEPVNNVHLLAYGAFACDFRCRFEPNISSIPILHGFLPEPFSSTAIRLGLKLTGLTLTEPQIAADGNVEVIFQNIVLVIEPGVREEENGLLSPFTVWMPAIVRRTTLGSQVAAGLGDSRTWLPFVVELGSFSGGQPIIPTIVPSIWLPFLQNYYVATQPVLVLRPIARLVGMQAMPPGAKKEDPLTVFVPVDGELGYPVPLLFIGFLEPYGGIEFSGLPISEPVSVGDGKFRQCFENLCLDLDTRVEGPSGLGLAPLGEIYKELYYPEPDEGQRLGGGGAVELAVTEYAQYVPSDKNFEIRVTITEGGVPLRNREPYLIVTPPNEKQQKYRLEPSDAAGDTYFSIPPINAPNVSIIPYTVCLDVANSEPVCVEDHYLIWNYP